MRTHRFETPGPVDLHIGIKSGQVHVETSDRDDTTVELVSSDDGLVEQVTVEHEPLSEGRHRIVVRVPRLRERNGGGTLDVHVRVPEQALADVETADGDVRLGGSYREVKTNTASGDVEVGQVSGAVSINTASGDVSVDSAGGRLAIRTASADVRCGRLGADGDIKTASGDVRIDSAADRVAVATGSGDISLGESDDCKLRTASGDLRIDAIRQGLADLKTASGDIEVAVVSGAVVAVDAESTTGDLSSEIDLSGNEPGDVAESDGDRQVELILRTVNGDIQIRRARARATA